MNKHTILFRIKQFIKHYFGFTKTETNAAMVLIPLLVFILFIPKIYSNLFEMKYDNSEDQVLLDSIMLKIESALVLKEEKPLEFQQFDFNPNTTSTDSLQLLGIPKFLANRIGNYRAKGGSFKIKADLSKIYDFPDSLFQQLYVYIDLPEKVRSKRTPKEIKSQPDPIDSLKVDLEITTKEKVIFETVEVDIALADTIELRKLYGIGPAYAARIVKYREVLGGFTRVDQLKEVYGISDSLYSSLEKNLIVSEIELEKLKINLATFKELVRHPYISYEQTKEILNAKSRFGKFKSSQDLYRLEQFDSLQIKNLIPYLDFR